MMIDTVYQKAISNNGICIPANVLMIGDTLGYSLVSRGSVIPVATARQLTPDSGTKPEELILTSDNQIIQRQKKLPQ